MAESAGAVTQYFRNIKNAVVSVFEGMAVTFSYLSRKPSTVQWPDRMEDKRPLEEQLPERYRGILEVDMTACGACLACQRICPVGSIIIDVAKDPETKKRMMTRFDIDAAKCMYCGLCVESCETGALYHTREFAHSTSDIGNLVLRFVDKPIEPIKIKKGERPPHSIKSGELVRKMLSNPQRKMAAPRRRIAPAPISAGFAEIIEYEGQPDIEDLKKRAQEFYESNKPAPKKKAPPPKPAAKEGAGEPAAKAAPEKKAPPKAAEKSEDGKAEAAKAAPKQEKTEKELDAGDLVAGAKRDLESGATSSKHPLDPDKQTDVYGDADVERIIKEGEAGKADGNKEE